MSDNDQAISSDSARSEVSSTPQMANLFLIIIGVGIVLLLCIGLLFGSSILFVRSTLATSLNDGPTVDSMEIMEDEAVTSDGPGEITESQNSRSPSDTISVVADETDSSPVTGTPQISSITFARETTANGEPIEPDFSFEEGTTQIFAIFEYADLAPNMTWTQVWYHNGNELLSTSQPWLEGESGVFNYVIETGGDPLPSGQWTLEFYIDGELLIGGSFVIESQDDALEADNKPDLADIPRVYNLVYTELNHEGKHDLYVSDTNGSFKRFIMRRAAGPSWSPTGQHIFFYGQEGVDQQIINGETIPLAGVSNGIARLNAAPLPANVSQIQVFQGHGWNDGTARWANVSPDGTMIAYDGDRGGGRRIYFLGTSANQQFRYEIMGEQADWSPDSQKIVYRSGRNNQFGLWISNRDDSGHRRITDGGTDSFPTWSLDGKTIAFSRDVGGNVDIYTVNIEGGNLQRLTTAPGHDTLPAYLPNGDLVFRSARTGSWGIWKMKGDGSNQIEIIPNAGVGSDWSFSKMGVLR